MSHLFAHPYCRRRRRAVAVLPSALLTLLALVAAPPLAFANPPPVQVAQYPLTAAVPAHPQVVLALGNSESMDGQLGGAIMTGSGYPGGGAAAELAPSSSPPTYVIPTGFTPPLNPGVGGVAPYTVSANGNLYDNSPSRLNTAKQAMQAILNQYMEYADFALVDYAITEAHWEATSVFYMSPAGQDFSFTSTPGSSRFVANPCYNANTTGGDMYGNNCAALQTLYGPTAISQPDLLIGASSDDEGINDVLYWAGGPVVCVTYGGAVPASPYSNPLINYETNSITETYPSSISGCPLVTAPTDSGFVPFSQSVMYVARGFGWGGVSLNFVRNLVNMKSSGADPTPASVAAAIAPFTPFLQPESNNFGTADIKASGYESAAASLVEYAHSYFTTNNPPSNNGCPPTRYIVLVTDGMPTMDMAGHSWPPLGSAAAAGYGITATFNADGSLNSTNSQALTDAITQITAAAAAGIKVYVLGLGAGVDPALNPQAAGTLTAMAVAGGTNNYFAATSPAAVTSDMQVILAKILAETAATSSSAVNSTGINTTSVAYQGTFTTSDTYQDWTGNLLAFPINAQTGYINTALSAASWSARTQLDAQPWDTGRLIATWDPVAGAGTPFEWNSSASATQGIAATTALGEALETYTPDPSGQDVLDYLRGDTALEQRNGGTFRSRAHILGDIVDSSPLYVAGPAGPWQQNSYIAFEGANAHRQPVIYIGANDGMLHAFSAATGNELFAYIPNGVYNNLVNLASPYYNEEHLFYVNGSPQAADVQYSSDQSWHTLLFGGEQAGGSSIYALDVTNPSQFTTENAVAQAVLWEFTDGNMGLTFSAPVAVNTAAGFTIMFGNGYDSPTGSPYLYALNPQTGAVMAKINLCGAVPTACNAAAANGLSNVVAANTNGSLGGAANVVYAGDLQGNLWRVNISDPNPSNWSVSVLFQARDNLGNRQPITVTPQVTLNPLVPALTGMMVYFATGQYLGIPDLTNVRVQTVYGVYDNGSAPANPLLRANLVQQTLTSAVVTTTQNNVTTIRQLTSNPVNLPSNHGWFVDLNLVSGERVVTDPALFNGTLQVTSFQPNGSTCTGGGNAWYMVFNYATGGATVVPQFDWNGQNVVNSNDLYNGQTVAGVSLGAAYAAGPKMITGAGGAMVYTTSGAGEITSGAGAGTCTSVAGTNSCIPNWANADSQSRGAWEEIR